MNEQRRLLDALENIAAEMERLRLLKEHKLGVRVEYEEGDPYIQVKPAEE
jgi:hypothetical protein